MSELHVHDWGDEDGTAVLTRELFSSSRAVADVYVLDTVPPFAGRSS